MLGVGRNISVNPNGLLLPVTAGLSALMVIAWLTRSSPQLRMFQNSQSASRPDRILFACAIIGQFLIAAFLGGSFEQDWTFAYVIILVSVQMLTRTGEEILKSLTQVGFGVLIVSWFLLFTPLNDPTFPSGYSLNPLGYRFMGLMSHPNLFGIVVTVTISLLLTSKKIPWIKLMVCVLSLLVSEYRGGIIASLILFLVFGFLKKFAHKKLVMTLGSALAASVVVLISVPRANASDLTTGRDQIWSICLNLIDSNPVYGAGPRTIEKLYGVDTVDWFRPFHCHNQLLDDLTNFGFLGGLFLTLGLLALVWVKMKAGDLRTSLFALSIVVCSFFESPVRLFASGGYLFVPILVFSLSFAQSLPGSMATEQNPRKIPATTSMS